MAEVQDTEKVKLALRKTFGNCASLQLVQSGKGDRSVNSAYEWAQ